MPTFGPIKRKKFMKYMRQLGFHGPYSGGKHQFLERNDLQLRIPTPHQSDIGPNLLGRLLKQADISKEEWEQL